MRYIFSLLRFAIVIVFLVLLNSCAEEQPEDIYKTLEEKGKINTFPLNIVLTSNLAGDNFPDDLKNLAALSGGPCKTLPVAGILRLGPDQYYTYNGVSTLTLGPDDKDEKSITNTVIAQTNEYLAKTGLANFDSLKVPIRSDYSSQIMATEYIKGTDDSVFFYSAISGSPDLTVMGGRSYPVYKDVRLLRKKIDELICGKQATISVIYTPSPTAGAIPGATSANPAQGMYAGDTCVGHSKFEKLNDGKGNLFIGKLLEENSKSCGFAFPTGVAGDTCIGRSRYQRLHNGRGGYTLGQLVEKNSTACGFTYPTGLAGDSCFNGSKYQKMHDGKGGFVLGNLVEKNSRSCGFKAAPVTPPVIATAPVKPAAIPPVKTPAIVTNRPAATKSVPVSPVPTTVPTTVPQTTRPSTSARPQTARQVERATDLPDAGTPPAPLTAADKRCARTTEALCEQDAGGNYTGRRVQYCYNSAGKIVRTIVLAKCDSDCRCLGK